MNSRLGKSVSCLYRTKIRLGEFQAVYSKTDNDLQLPTDVVIGNPDTQGATSGNRSQEWCLSFKYKFQIALNSRITQLVFIMIIFY